MGDGSPATRVRQFTSKARPSPYDCNTAARILSSNGHEVRSQHRVTMTTRRDWVIMLSYMRRPRPLGSSLSDEPAYGSHSVYLFSTLGDPMERSLGIPPQISSPNSERQKTGDGSLLARPGGREEEEEGRECVAETNYSEIPVVLPRRLFSGISNLRTIEDGTDSQSKVSIPLNVCRHKISITHIHAEGGANDHESSHLDVSRMLRWWKLA